MENGLERGKVEDQEGAVIQARNDGGHEDGDKRLDFKVISETIKKGAQN